MLIRMNETRRGSPDGFESVQYEKDKVYDIPNTLATSFLRQRWAHEIFDSNDKPYNASKFTGAYINGSDDFKEGALQMMDFITDHPDIFEDAKNQVRSVFVDDVLRFARKPLPNPHMSGAPLMSAVRQSDALAQAIDKLHSMIDGGEECRGRDSEISDVIRLLEGTNYGS